MDHTLPHAHEDTEEVRRFIEACRRREAELSLLHRGSEPALAQGTDLARLLLEYSPPSEGQAQRRRLVPRLASARRERR